MFKKASLLSLVLSAPLLCMGLPAAQATGEMAGANGHLSLAPAEELTLTLEIPVFAEDFSETPVALVNEEPIRLWELRKQLAAMHTQMEGEATEAKKDYRKLLTRLIETRLILQEARNIGLDELDFIQKEITAFRKKALYEELMAHHLRDLTPDPAEVESLYQLLSRELRLWSLQFKERKNANFFLEKLAETGDFEALAEEFIEKGQAVGEKDETFQELKSFQPKVAMALFDQEPGFVSQIFENEEGSVIFRLEESRFKEDPEVEQEAFRKVSDRFRQEKATEYGEELEERYATIDRELFEELDLADEAVDFEALLQDERVLATVRWEGQEPETITVAELVGKIKSKIFHGVEQAVKSGKLNKQKEILLHNLLFEILAPREASKLGLDQTREFKFKLEEQMNGLLFGAFIDKVVIPGLEVSEEEIKEHYEQNLEEFSTPVMMRLRSLVLDQEAPAQEALAKLRKDADFNWVSANATGLVADDAKGVLDIDRKLLSLKAVPEDLQKLLEEPAPGRSLLYPGKDYFYVLQIAEVFPAKPSPFDQVRGEIRKKLFVAKIQEALDEYTDKLQEVYDTRIFVKGLD